MKKFGHPAIDALRIFAVNVSRLREQRRRSVEQLANHIGMDPGVLILIEEACYPDVNIVHVAQIADALYVPLAQLFEEPE